MKLNSAMRLSYHHYSTIAINTIIVTPTNMANISLMDCQIDVAILQQLRNY